jgi:hypothetical protein
MIKFILNKQETSTKAKIKRKTRSRTLGIERLIPDNDAKDVVVLIHTYKHGEVSNRLGFPKSEPGRKESRSR